MTEQNWQAYEHYRECRAVGQFPDDPIVRRNAATIRQIEDAYDRQQISEPIETLVQLLIVRGVGRGG